MNDVCQAAVIIKGPATWTLNASQAQIIFNSIAMCFVGAPKTRNRFPATHVGLQMQKKRGDATLALGAW